MRDYPASAHVDASKSRLTEMKRPIPAGDPAAYARMKYDIEHRTREGIWGRTMGVITGHPDVGSAAKNGAPIMTAVRPTAPVSVPPEAAGSVAANANGSGVGGVSDVGIGVAGNSLEGKTDARLGVATGEGEQKASVGPNGQPTDPAAALVAPLPTQSSLFQEATGRAEEATGQGCQDTEEGRRRCGEEVAWLRGPTCDTSDDYRYTLWLNTGYRPAMSRILLADDSPHAQRMGERILRDEGHEVITVSDGKVAMLRLEDAQPDLIIADMSMPEISGFELCEYVKRTGGGPVILTAGPVEPIDGAEVDRVRADGILRKPFEASALLESIGRFVSGRKKPVAPGVRTSGVTRSVAVIDPEQVRAAVTVALDAAMPGLIDQITDQSSRRALRPQELIYCANFWRLPTSADSSPASSADYRHDWG